jgi:hypothetical protein
MYIIFEKSCNLLEYLNIEIKMEIQFNDKTE